MNQSLRKGWCPGARRPMPAKDGLLVRLRITGGILPAMTAGALADLATSCGNGLFDLSARGNLQMRGVSPRSLPVLQDRLHALELLDADDGAESVRNVVASPLAGLHGGIDVRPLVRQLEARLTSDASLHALPDKFGFLVDDSGPPSLAGIGADVRFDWLPADKHFSIGLAGARDAALRIGFCDARDLVENAAAIARGAQSMLTPGSALRRMYHAIAALGTDTVARLCGGVLREALPPAASTRARDVVGSRSVRLRSRTMAWLGLAAPFGRLDADMLRDAASLATRTAVGELRLTPWRTILIPGATGTPTDIAGFITDSSDPRLVVAACVGAEGCERGSTSTHADAARLAADVVAAGDADIVLHVSGCPKGCAKPSASPLTLVARKGRYDLVRDGRADDVPSRCALDVAAARHAMLELA